MSLFVHPRELQIKVNGSDLLINHKQSVRKSEKLAEDFEAIFYSEEGPVEMNFKKEDQFSVEHIYRLFDTITSSIKLNSEIHKTIINSKKKLKNSNWGRAN